MNRIILGDNLDALRELPDGIASLVYIDPPFNTGKVQTRTRIKTFRDSEGDRTGFKGQRYRSVRVGSSGYTDNFDDYLQFLVPRLAEGYRILSPTGAFFLHIDFREVHYCKIALDEIFGRDSFMNEIIWAYDYGARSKSKWPAKHDNILWYAKNPDQYTFNYEAMDRLPYMAPGLVTPEKAERGKTPTDVWWHTIVSPNGREKTGYPTQKPLGILERIIKVHTRPGELCVDFFAGSGSLGEAAARHDRNFLLIDSNPEAATVMAKRLVAYSPQMVGFNPSRQEAGVDSTHGWSNLSGD